jgi:hypothetical protein
MQCQGDSRMQGWTYDMNNGAVVLVATNLSGTDEAMEAHNSPNDEGNRSDCWCCDIGSLSGVEGG